MQKISFLILSLFMSCPHICEAGKIDDLLRVKIRELENERRTIALDLVRNAECLLMTGVTPDMDYLLEEFSTLDARIKSTYMDLAELGFPSFRQSDHTLLEFVYQLSWVRNYFRKEIDDYPQEERTINALLENGFHEE